MQGNKRLCWIFNIVIDIKHNSDSIQEIIIMIVLNYTITCVVFGIIIYYIFIQNTCLEYL